MTASDRFSNGFELAGPDEPAPHGQARVNCPAPDTSATGHEFNNTAPVTGARHQLSPQQIQHALGHLPRLVKHAQIGFVAAAGFPSVGHLYHQIDA